MEEFSARFIDALVSVCAEEIALRLQQVGRQVFRAVSIKERQCSRERRSRYTDLNRVHNRLPPARLVLVQRAREEVVQQQILQIGILIKRRLDVAEEHRTDDAAATPHQRNPAHVQMPALVLLRRTQQHVTLRVRDHL